MGQSLDAREEMRQNCYKKMVQIMAGAEHLDFVHIVSGGGLRDPAERLRKLECMLNCTRYIMWEFFSWDNLLISNSYPELLPFAYLVATKKFWYIKFENWFVPCTSIGIHMIIQK